MYRENCENNHKNLKLRQKGKLILITPYQTNKILKLILKFTSYTYTNILYTYHSTLYERKWKSVLIIFKEETKKEPTTLLLLANPLTDHQNL
jgi:hypothetical protein